MIAQSIDFTQDFLSTDIRLEFRSGRISSVQIAIMQGRGLYTNSRGWALSMGGL